MNRMPGLTRLTAALLSLCAAAAVGAQESSTGTSTDIEYAEHLPLAPHSLLLDSLRVGDRIIAAGERGHIVISGDGGVTWEQAEVVPTRSTLTTLAAAGDRLWAAGHDSVIMMSQDGGRNWTRQYFDPERFQPVMDLHFFDELRGIAIGAYGLMLITGDGGASWDEWAVNDLDDAHLNSMLELPDGTLLIAGEAGYSYRSRDQGETWESLELPYQGSMFRALADTRGCVLFAGLRGHAMRSCDAGDTWVEVDTGTQATMLDGVATPGATVLVGNGGTILHGEGDGAFRIVEHSSGVDFASVLDLGDGRFLLTGEEGFYHHPESARPEAAP